MKTLLLIVPALFIISCNQSSTSNSNVDTNVKLEQNEAVNAATTHVEEKKVEHVVKEELTDDSSIKESMETLSSSAKEEKNSITNKVNAISDKKNEVIAKSEVIKKEVVEKEVVEKEKKEPVILKADHDTWNKLSKKYVSSNGKVNYKGFKSELAVIENYLLHLQNTSPTKGWSKNEKLAYWFNLYNASTVHLVASNYPVKSIKDINGGKPWDKKFIKSGTHVYSLNDIENTIVRPNYNEPRLHVAFNCAAVSCPNLLNGAFIPAKLNTQLSSLSKKWLNDSSKNKITADNIEISEIFNWYKVDFKEGVIPFINKYNTTQVTPTAGVTYMKYNWSLNE